MSGKREQRILQIDKKENACKLTRSYAYEILKFEEVVAVAVAVAAAAAAVVVVATSFTEGNT